MEVEFGGSEERGERGPVDGEHLEVAHVANRWAGSPNPCMFKVLIMVSRDLSATKT